MLLLHPFSRLAVTVSLLALVGCSATNDPNSTGFDSSGAGAHHGAASGGDSGGATGFGGFAPGSGGSEPSTSSTGTGDPAGPAVVYAHSPSVLFKLDPDTKVVSKIGQFQGCDQITDIAIDKDGVMYGTTEGALYLIDTTTAACTQVATGSYPNSLSLVPQGTLDPNEEALVGYVGGEYVRIDKTSGAISHIGNIGHDYSSSGDIVSVIGGGTYLTVTGSGCSDCIVEVDPATGALMQTIGHLGHSQVFGLAFWAGAAYGFDNAGQLFQIDLTDGSTTLLSTGASVNEFWGAGSTTAAPLMPH